MGLIEKIKKFFNIKIRIIKCEGFNPKYCSKCDSFDDCCLINEIPLTEEDFKNGI